MVVIAVAVAADIGVFVVVTTAAVATAVLVAAVIKLFDVQLFWSMASSSCDWNSLR